MTLNRRALWTVTTARWPARCGLLVLLTAALSACSDAPEYDAGSAAESRPPAADLVLRGGRVSTVDPALGEVQAVAMRGFTITAVGSDVDIAAHIGPETAVIDLDGRRVVPGFIEGHGHYLSFGASLQMLDLKDARNWDDVVGQVARAVDGAAPGEWVFGRGWHQEKWDTLPDVVVDGVPVNDSLNAVSGDNPVWLGHASGHAAFVNDAALAAAGIEDDTADPDGGVIVRDGSGKATGLLRENAEELVTAEIDRYEARLTDAQMEARLREQVQLAGTAALSHGVTSFHDAGAPFAHIDLFRRMEAEAELPVRLYVMVRGESNATMAADLARYRMVAEGNDFLTVRSIKRQIDGALGAHGAWLLEPYEDMPASTGLVLEPIAEIERTAELAVEFGYQVNTHAIGTRANRETLDLYERVWQRMDADGSRLRWRIEHAQHIHPDDVPRFGTLGVVAAMQGVHCTSDGPWIATRLGEPRTGVTSYPWQDLLAGGAVLGNGTDVPVERIDALASFASSVTRRMNTGTAFYPEQALSRQQALESYTINNAYAAFEEDLKGSLTPGKLADLVVLSHDILTVPESELGNAAVDYTIVGGEVRYVRQGL